MNEDVKKEVNQFEDDNPVAPNVSSHHAVEKCQEGNHINSSFPRTADENSESSRRGREKVVQIITHSIADDRV